MIDFDKGVELINKFEGSEKKITVAYDGNIYMVKYPDPIKPGKLTGVISYKNNQFSEDIGSKIFNVCGIKAQDTELGYYTNDNGKRKVVVGCVDFTQNGGILYEAKKLANAIAPDEEKLDLSIENVNRIIEQTKSITDKKAIKDAFWDTFVIDTLIGNKDRHFGNWGILEKNGEISFSPVYDCGSSLSALVDNDEMPQLLNTPGKFKNAEYNIASVYYMNGERVRYHEIFKNPPNELTEAIKRVVPNIDINKINEIIESTEQMPDIRKEYLKKAISIRYEQILSPSLKKILRQEKTSRTQETKPQKKPSNKKTDIADKEKEKLSPPIKSAQKPTLPQPKSEKKPILQKLQEKKAAHKALEKSIPKDRSLNKSKGNIEL